MVSSVGTSPIHAASRQPQNQQSMACSGVAPSVAAQPTR